LDVRIFVEGFKISFVSWCLGVFVVNDLGRALAVARILALDLGSERIGVALSDETWSLASPYAVWKSSNKNLFKQLIEFPEQLECIVIGLPLGLDGSDSPQTVKVREIAEKIRRRVAVPVELFDERFTTKTAEQVLLAGGVSRVDRRKIIDQQAAVVILQQYLEHRRRRLKTTTVEQNQK